MQVTLQMSMVSDLLCGYARMANQLSQRPLNILVRPPHHQALANLVPVQEAGLAAGEVLTAGQASILAMRCPMVTVICAVRIVEMDRIKKALLILLILMTLVAATLGYYCFQLRGQLAIYVSQVAIDFDANTRGEVDELKKEGKPMIIVFGADYCPMCISYKPYIKELNRIYGEEIVIKYIDVVEHESIRKEYNIELVPSTIFYYANGEIYRPNDSIEVEPTTEVVEEYKYVSDKITIIDGDELALNNSFEYGIDENKELVYCKFVGLLEMLQIEQIAEELLDYPY